jgi:hypothetical protein
MGRRYGYDPCLRLSQSRVLTITLSAARNYLATVERIELPSLVLETKVMPLYDTVLLPNKSMLGLPLVIPTFYDYSMLILSHRVSAYVS